MESPKAFGPFEVRGELGRGAGGVAYVAWHPGEDRTAAVKLYSSAPREATGAIARLKRDAQAAGALGHPNIAAVLGVGEHGGWPWVATEFVPGVSLAQVLRGRALLPIERVLDVWRQICEGLAHAHREGVLHLDLKPSDVRLSPSGEVKLVDFGSWHIKALDHGVSGPVDGGLHYRAPELLVGRRPDGRADVFSAAAIVYELVAYRKAFPGDSTTDVVRLLARCEPDLACLPRSPFTPGFERVLALSLARAPEARHAAFEEVHADLVQLVRETAPRLRSQAEAGTAGSPEREELLANVTRARAEDRLEDALEGCRLLLERDSEDEAARRAMTEIEAVLVEREVDALAGMALAYAADGDLALATGIAEKVERLAPWSPRYLQLQVYLDEENARRQADSLVASAREHLAAGRLEDAREDAREAGQVMPGHVHAARLVQELGSTDAEAPSPTPPPPRTPAPPPPPPPRRTPAMQAAEPVREAPVPEPPESSTEQPSSPPPPPWRAAEPLPESPQPEPMRPSSPQPSSLPDEAMLPGPLVAAAAATETDGREAAVTASAPDPASSPDPSQGAPPAEAPAASQEPGATAPEAAAAGSAEAQAEGDGPQAATPPDLVVAALPAAQTPATPAEPVPAEPVPAEPAPAEPAPAEPVPAEPVPAEPVPAEPVPAEPVPAEPVPAEPVTAESATIQRARVEPASPPHPPAQRAPVTGESATIQMPKAEPETPPDPRVAEAVSLSAAALRFFLKDDHARARATVERALELDPGNRRALELQKILRVLG